MGTIRNFNIALEFQKYFHKVLILTTSNARFLSREPFPFEQPFKRIELFTLDYRRLLNALKRGKSYPGANFSGRWFAPFYHRLKDSFPTNLILDEGSLLYILNGYRKGKKLVTSENIEYLYSSYRPYADHLIAWLLKRKYPHLHWIADFRDAHVDLNRRNVYWVGLQKWFNKKILNRADVVTTVSNGLASYLSEFHSNVLTLRNGISPFYRSNGFSPEFFQSKFVIAYTGTLYPEQQSADLLFQALKELEKKEQIDLDKVELVYAGRSAAIWQKWVEKWGLGNHSRCLNELSLLQSYSLQQKSQINLLLTWSGPVFTGILTGKLYEYLAAGNPTLVLVRGKEDPELEEIIQITQLGLVAYDQPKDLLQVTNFLLSCYNEWLQTGKTREGISFELMQPYRWEVIMSEFMGGESPSSHH